MPIKKNSHIFIFFRPVNPKDVMWDKLSYPQAKKK